MSSRALLAGVSFSTCHSVLNFIKNQQDPGTLFMTYILAVSENMQQIRGVSNHVFLPPENTSLKPIGLVPTLIETQLHYHRQRSFTISRTLLTDTFMYEGGSSSLVANQA